MRFFLELSTYPWALQPLWRVYRNKSYVQMTFLYGRVLLALDLTRFLRE